MLIEFRVENHRSIREEQGLTLQAGNVDGDVTRIREVAGLRLLPVAAFYGANASGKTNVLAALQFMRDAVTHSHRFWAPGEGVPREPFAWGPKREEPSLFQAEFLIDGVRHDYGFVVDDTQVLEEWLRVSPNGRPQTWFEREAGVFRFGEHLKGENRAVEHLTRPNDLFLSAAAQNNHEQLDPVFQWFRSVHGEGTRRDQAGAWFAGERPRTFARGSRGFQVDALLPLLRTADVGIVDIKVTSAEPPGPPLRGRRSGVQLRHKGTADDTWLALEEESNGTRRLFKLGPLIIDALSGGGVVMIDELEAGLHPLLALEIVRTFHDPKKNPKNAQLLFSTHDTNLLGTIVGEPALRRDQVWLTEKDDEGGTSFYPMTDYKPRKSENLERGYLQGRYGAIPFLGALSWAGEP